jgi:hypothetical protein
MCRPVQTSPAAQTPTSVALPPGRRAGLWATTMVNQHRPVSGEGLPAGRFDPRSGPFRAAAKQASRDLPPLPKMASSALCGGQLRHRRRPTSDAAAPPRRSHQRSLPNPPAAGRSSPNQRTTRHLTLNQCLPVDRHHPPRFPGRGAKGGRGDVGRHSVARRSASTGGDQRQIPSRPWNRRDRRPLRRWNWHGRGLGRRPDGRSSLPTARRRRHRVTAAGCQQSTGAGRRARSTRDECGRRSSPALSDRPRPHRPAYSGCAAVRDVPAAEPRPPLQAPPAVDRGLRRLPWLRRLPGRRPPADLPALPLLLRRPSETRSADSPAAFADDPVWSRRSIRNPDDVQVSPAERPDVAPRTLSWAD